MAGGTTGRIIERPVDRTKGVEVPNEEVDNAQIFSEAVPAADREMREQIDATSQALAAADQEHLTDEIGSAGWERRGLLQRLRRRPRPGAR
jgi:hypothetical protein